MRVFRVLLISCGIPICVAGQTVRVTGSIEGQISGLPASAQRLPLVIAAHSKSPSHSARATADKQGNYKISELPFDTYTVLAVEPDSARSVTKTITLTALTPDVRVDFPFAQSGSISGDVLDEDEKPFGHAQVELLTRDYVNGLVALTMKFQARADEAGHYELKGVQPGRTYYLRARNLQGRELVSVWYPNSRSARGAAPITIRSGEDRANTKIHVRKEPAWCVNATLTEAGKAAPLTLMVQDSETGMVGSPVMMERADADGKIRICGLASGTYTLTAVRFGSEKTPPAVGRLAAVVRDEDLTGVRIDATQAAGVHGEFVWDGDPPAKEMAAHGTIFLRSPSGMNFVGQTQGTAASLPGRFTLRNVVEGEYIANATISSDGGRLYVKDITWAGRSVLNGRLTVGSEASAPELRVVIGQEGPTIAARVLDARNEPVADSSVIIAPVSAATESDFAAVMTRGETDQAGVWISPSLAPGRYKVAAAGFLVDQSAETVGRAWRLIQGAEIYELGPKARVEVRLKPGEVE